MRITNSMITNNTLININRNQRYLNKITQQIESTKKIQAPSDDPIVASRALKFRTNVSETKQFLRNTQSGMSWMEISEASFIDLSENLMVRLESLMTEGATGSETLSDKMTIITTIKSLIDQVGLDMNQTYAGRYVFSGYRTDEPPVLIEDNAKLAYVITQQFNLDDIESVKSFQKGLDQIGYNASTSEPEVVNGAKIIKLAYNSVGFRFEMTDKDGNAVVPGIKGAPGTGSPPEAPLVYNVIEKSILDAGVYSPPGAETETGTAANPYTVHYIKETGEMVFNAAAAETFRDGTEVTYYKEGFHKGELNPLVYFDCVEATGKAEPPAVTITLNDPVYDNGKFTLSANVDIDGTVTNVPLTTDASEGPSIRVNNVVYDIWSLPTSQASHAGPPPIWDNTFTLNQNGLNLNIIQKVSIETVNGVPTYKMDYSVFNKGTEAVSIDFTQHMKPVLGDDDNLLFNGVGYPGTSQATSISVTSSDPDQILAGAISVTGGGISGSGNVNPPNVINVGNSDDVDRFGAPQDALMTDSAYALTWSGQTIEPDGFFTMSSSYGVKDNSAVELVAGNSYSMDDQYIKYECATNTYVRINDLAKNAYTDKMYADFKRLIEFAESLKVSDRKSLEEMYSQPPYNLTGTDLQKSVNDQLTDETAVINAVLHDRFNNMLDLLQRHTDGIVTEHTQLGSRMLRLDLLQVRLEEDQNTYSKLMTENEGTDMEYAIMQKLSAEAAYQASLSANANIMQLTLANYI